MMRLSMKQGPLRASRFLVPLFLSLATCAEHHDRHAHWSYAGETGPAHWGELNPEFALCSTGKHQSPIDLAKVEMKDLPDIVFNYKPVDVDIVNNGHTIQVNEESGGSIEIDGTTYVLAQFHLHAPSEHTIDGRHARAELHWSTSRQPADRGGRRFPRGRGSQPPIRLRVEAPARDARRLPSLSGDRECE
jgi:carbonic anhydrase